MAFRTGRLRPSTPPRYFLSNFVLDRAALPPTPPTCNWIAPSLASINKIYKNDQLGDCVIAAMWHLLGLWTGNAGQVALATDQEIVSDYSAIGGYIPGKPQTDQGCDEHTALDYYSSTGWPGGHKIDIWMAVDATDQQLIQTGLFMFEGGLLTVEMPDAWVQNEPSKSGFVLDVAGPPNPNNGHAMAITGYGKGGIEISEWGMWGIMTDAAFKKYCVPSAGGNIYVAASHSQLANGLLFAPNGYDWPGIASAANTMGGGAT